jgi:c-di-GMP-binding flagellar brake protein YcgR
MPVLLKRFGMEDMQPVSARTINFSDGGMLLVTNENLAADDMIVLNFHTVRHETVQAVVIRAEATKRGAYAFRAAVKFENVSKEQRERFYRFIWGRQLEKRQGTIQTRR